MKLETVILPDPLPVQRLYSLLRRMTPQIRETALRLAFDRRDVKMNGIRVRRDAEALPGATVQIYLSDEGACRSPEILFEDDRILIVNKPIGISSDADDQGGPTLGEWLFQSGNGRFATPPMPCHRLDNPTDGLLVMAKDENTLAAMQMAFHDRQVTKRYQCLVRGVPTPAQAMLSAYLYKDARKARVSILDAPVPGALTIHTEYQVLQAGEVSRLDVTLHTGRTHQIRAHLAYIGHPLLGDDKYGDRDFNRAHHAKRLMLTAVELCFQLTGELQYLNDLHLRLMPKF